MEVSITEAAARLGKSERQIRYMIQQGKLAGRRDGSRWRVELQDAPVDSRHEQRVQARQDKLRETVEQVLDLSQPAERKRRYSLRNLKAWQICRPLYAETLQHLGAEHPVAGLLRDCLHDLARGCHRFGQRDKREAYVHAREQASLAACELYLNADPVSERIAETIEQEMVAAFAELWRRNDGGRY